MELKYKIKGKFEDRVKEFACPKMPFGPLKETHYQILDNSVPKEPTAPKEHTPVEDFRHGKISREWSYW